MTIVITNLNPIDMLKGPFTMIFHGPMAKCCPVFLSVHHTIVTTITLAIPLFPLQVKRFLHVPRAIKWCTIRREFAVWKASVPNTSSLFALCYTNPKIHRTTVSQNHSIFTPHNTHKKSYNFILFTDIVKAKETYPFNIFYKGMKTE